MSDTERAVKRRPTVRVDLDFPLSGEWVEIEQRALSPRNMAKAAPMLEGMDDLGKGDSLVGIGPVFDRVAQLTEFIGPFIVDASDFLDEPYEESFQDLWTPGVMEVAQSFFQQAGGGSPTNENSSEQSSAETKAPTA